MRFHERMRRIVPLFFLFALAVCAPAEAVLVYERPATDAIVAARNGGSNPRVIARGGLPQVAPNGRRVIFLKRHGNTSEDDLRLVDIDGGQSRLLLSRGYYQAPLGSQSWSPNSRYLIGVDGQSRPHIFDLVGKTQHVIARDGWAYKASTFSPHSSRIVFNRHNIDHRGDPGILEVRGLRGRNPHRVASGDTPVWGRGGLAFKARAGIKLKPCLEGRSRLILREPFGFRYPVDWSKDGRRLLVARGSGDHALQALILVPETDTVITLPQTFYEVAGLSKDGKRVLGVVGEEVVSVAADGSMRTLARGAQSASWTK